MQFDWLDFVTGLGLANAMPHLLFGLLNIRFLSLFGYSARANVVYGSLNLLVSLVVFHLKYGLDALLAHGMMLGGLFVVVGYLLLGRALYRWFNKPA